MEMAVFNLKGERISTLYYGLQNAGPGTVQWSAADVPSGIYLIQGRFSNMVHTKKVLLLK